MRTGERSGLETQVNPAVFAGFVELNAFSGNIDPANARRILELYEAARLAGELDILDWTRHLSESTLRKLQASQIPSKPMLPIYPLLRVTSDFKPKDAHPLGAFLITDYYDSNNIRVMQPKLTLGEVGVISDRAIAKVVLPSGEGISVAVSPTDPRLMIEDDLYALLLIAKTDARLAQVYLSSIASQMSAGFAAPEITIRLMEPLWQAVEASSRPANSGIDLQNP